MTSNEVFVEELRKRRGELQRSLRAIQSEQARLAAELSMTNDMLSHIEALLLAEKPDEFGPKASEALIQDDWAGLTINGAIQRVLRDAEKPMHADDILRILREHGMTLSHLDPKATVVTALVRGTQRGVYVRTAPNTYGLAPPGAPTLLTQRQMDNEMGGVR